MQIAIWIVGIAVALFALDRLGLWAEAKGWIYWRKVKRKGSGGAALDVASIIDPSARHAAEARQQQTVEDEDDGDDERKPDDRVS